MPIPRQLLEAYSLGEITRRDIAERVAEPVSFGQLLMLLHEHHLPLPRLPSDPQAPGVLLIKEMAERGPRAG